MIDPSTPTRMARLLLLLIPVMTIAAIAHDHAATCKVAYHSYVGRMPVCE
jgi:hypothetical protein